jgi:hypothetical protein
MLFGTACSVKLNVGTDEAEINLSIKKPFKNAEGSYDVDIIPVQFKGYLSEIVRELAFTKKLSKGSKLMIKGRLEFNSTLNVIAERIQFLEGGE